MTDDLVKAAREALAGVTAGPWHVTECGDYWIETADTARGVALCGAMEWPHADTRQIEWENNARFIAAARSLVPAMADRIEALEAENAKFIATARSLVPAMADRIVAQEAEIASLIQDRNCWAEEAQVETSPIVFALQAENARLKAASVITGPGEAARILLEASDGSMPLEAKMAAARAVIAREGKCQPVSVVQAWQAALEALIDNPGKEVMPDDFGMDRKSTSHDAAPASPSAGEGAEIGEAEALQSAATARDLTECFWCGRRGLSPIEDGGPECELSDGQWVCSRECYDSAIVDARLNAVEAKVARLHEILMEQQSLSATDFKPALDAHLGELYER